VTAIYEGNDVSFVYPENWKLSESHDEGWPRGVEVESPTGAFLSLHLYLAGSEEPDLLLDSAVESLREEYDHQEMEIVPSDRPLFDIALSQQYGEAGAGKPPTSASVRDISFSLLDFIVRIRFLCFEVKGRLVLAICQAEDREFDQIEPVYQAMLWSLVHPQEQSVRE
jgi:hypothetical protein